MKLDYEPHRRPAGSPAAVGLCVLVLFAALVAALIALMANRFEAAGWCAITAAVAAVAAIRCGPPDGR